MELATGGLVIGLTRTTLAYPAQSLGDWKKSCEMLNAAKADPHVKRIIREKVRRRSKPGRRFFGEAFVVSEVGHKKGHYGSFQWLTNPLFLADRPFAESPTADFKNRLRKDLHFYFGAQLVALQQTAQRLRDRIGVKPAGPDLWLIGRGTKHRFIEVKLPGDQVHDNQLAGLAVIATSLRAESVSVEVIELYPDGGSEPFEDPSMNDLFNKFVSEIEREGRATR